MNTRIFTKRVRFVLAASLVLALFIAISSGGALSGTVQTLLSPIRSLTAAAARTAERYYNYAFNYEHLEAENAILKEKITSMEEDIRDADILARENARYKTLLGLAQEHKDYTFLPAYIVSWDNGNWKSTFTISKGNVDGVTTGMCAVTEYGQVIGMVTDSGPTWASVTTILDTSLEVSASIASSGYTGVVEGSYRVNESGNLRLNYLPTDAVLKNGDQVVTTGSTLHPKDLILGFIIDAGLDDTGVSKYALLESAVNFNSLEQVYIITNYDRTAARPVQEEEPAEPDGQ